jgi:uncharacterized protein YukE
MTENNLYKKEEDMVTDIMNLERFGKVDKETGEFKHNPCKKCQAPLLGHIVTESECTMEGRYSENQIEDIKKYVENVYFWDISIARIDKRPKAVKCEVCGIKSTTRNKKEDHVKMYHKDFLDLSGMNMKSILANLTVAVTNCNNTNANSMPRTTQITKAKPPPRWAGEKFDKFKEQVKAWDEANKAEAYEKYGDLIESLKKNPVTKQYVSDVIIERTPNIEDKMVEKIMTIMEEKFGRTKTERLYEVLKSILEFSVEEEESDKEYWDRFKKLLNDANKEEVTKHFNYIMCIMMINKATEKGKISEEE